jgi:hypothetical protein
MQHRALFFLLVAAGTSLVVGGGDSALSFPECVGDPHSNPSLLGVGNPKCLKRNTFVSGMLVILIIALSLLAETVIHQLKHSPQLKCPLMQKIVAKLIEEVMILGLISMSLFILTQLGVIRGMSDVLGHLNFIELFHFLEFIHYLIFLTMIFYIASVVVMILASNKTPQLWQLSSGEKGDKKSAEQNKLATQTMREKIRKAKEKKDGITIAREYMHLKEQRRALGWRVKFRLSHWYSWWLAVNRMGYQLANQSSRHVYEDRDLVERVFDIDNLDEFLDYEVMTYSRYSTFCVRAVLVKILEINWTTWFVLMIIIFMSAAGVSAAGGATEAFSARPTEEHIRNIVYCGLLLLLAAIIIFVKTFQILMGIVNDRDKMICRFVRFTPLMDEAHNPGATCVQMSCIQFFHKGSSKPIAIKSAESADDEGEGDNGPHCTIDNSTVTMWRGVANVPLEIELKTAQTIDQYWWSTAPTASYLSNCSPKKWKLEGRLDKHSPWALIDEHTDEHALHGEGSHGSVTVPNAGGKFLSSKIKISGAVQTAAALGAQFTPRQSQLFWNSHDGRFWFKSPRLMARILRFIYFFQAIYLACVLLVFATTAAKTWNGLGALLVLVPPALILFILSPMTVPVLVLVLDLTGHIGAHKITDIEKRAQKHAHHLSHVHRQHVAFCPFCGNELHPSGETKDESAALDENKGPKMTFMQAARTVKVVAKFMGNVSRGEAHCSNCDSMFPKEIDAKAIDHGSHGDIRAASGSQPRVENMAMYSKMKQKKSSPDGMR